MEHEGSSESASYPAAASSCWDTPSGLLAPPAEVLPGSGPALGSCQVWGCSLGSSLLHAYCVRDSCPRDLSPACFTSKPRGVCGGPLGAGVDVGAAPGQGEPRLPPPTPISQALSNSRDFKMSPNTYNKHNHSMHVCQQAFFFEGCWERGQPPQERSSRWRAAGCHQGSVPGAGKGLVQDSGQVKGWRKGRDQGDGLPREQLMA